MKLLVKSLPFLFLILWAGVAQAINIPNPVEGFLISYENNTFPALIIRFINLLLSVISVITILFIIIGGFQYIMARGDEEQATSGKKTLSNAIIGLVIALLSLTIVAVIQNAVRGNV